MKRIKNEAEITPKKTDEIEVGSNFARQFSIRAKSVPVMVGQWRERKSAMEAREMAVTRVKGTTALVVALELAWAAV